MSSHGFFAKIPPRVLLPGRYFLHRQVDLSDGNPGSFPIHLFLILHFINTQAVCKGKELSTVGFPTAL